MKCIVETTGNHMLIHTRTSEVIEAHRPSVCREDDFTHTQVVMRNARMLARDIPESVTDEEWHEWWLKCDKDTDLAVASFVSKLNVNTVSDQANILDLKPPEVVAPTLKPAKK